MPAVSEARWTLRENIVMRQYERTGSTKRGRAAKKTSLGYKIKTKIREERAEQERDRSACTR